MVNQTTKNYPSFMPGYKAGELQINLDLTLTFSDACKTGKAGAYDFIRYLNENEFLGGDLQSVVLALADQPKSEALNGFIIGMFSEFEILLRQAYDTQQKKQSNPLTNTKANAPIALNQSVRCQAFIKSLPERYPDVAVHLYEMELLKDKPVKVINGEDYFTLTQHHKAFNAALNETGYQGREGML